MNSKSSVIEVEYLFSYISNIIELICNRLLLRFDIIEIGKNYASLEGSSSYFLSEFCVLNKTESQTAKCHGMEVAFKLLALAFS